MKGILGMKTARDMYENYFRLYEFQCYAKPEIKERLRQEPDIHRRLMMLSEIPKKYWKYVWDGQIRDNLAIKNADNDKSIKTIDNYLANLNEKKDDGEGIYIYGDTGTSKTTTALIIAKEAIKRNYSTFYLCSTDIREFVISTYGDLILKSFWEYITHKIDFLIIDDIGADFDMSPKERTILERIIRYRYNNLLPIIFTTNVEKSVLIDLVGNSVMSRLMDAYYECYFDIKDVREENRLGGRNGI